MSTGDGWSNAAYAHAALLLVNSTHGAVPRDDMLAQLGSHVTDNADNDPESMGVTVLETLVHANLLAVRPYSAWTYDVPREAFGAEKGTRTVTAPTPAELYCMRLMQPELQDKLDRWRASKLAQTIRYVHPHAVPWTLTCVPC